MADENMTPETEAVESAAPETTVKQEAPKASEETPVVEKIMEEAIVADKPVKSEFAEGDAPVREDDRGERSHRPDKKRFFYTKKVCKFCTGQIDEKNIDYKAIDILRRYVMPSGKIVPRRITGNCARHQRMVTTEIKKARILAFLPYVDR